MTVYVIRKLIESCFNVTESVSVLTYLINLTGFHYKTKNFFLPYLKSSLSWEHASRFKKFVYWGDILY